MSEPVHSDVKAVSDRDSLLFWIAIAMSTALAIILRVLYLRFVGEPIPRICDASSYYQLGTNLAEGKGYVNWYKLKHGGQSLPTANFPPLYPALLALLHHLGLHTQEVQRYAVAMLGVVNVPILAFAGRRIAGPVAGGAAALIAAISPALIEIDGSFMSEGLYLTFVSLTIFVILYAEDHAGWHSWGVVGVLLGLASLARSEGIILLGLMAIPIAWERGRGQALMPRVVPVLAAGVGAILVVGPWTIRNAIQFEALIPVSQSYNSVLAGANCWSAYSMHSELGGWVVPCVRLVEPNGLGEVKTFDVYRTAGVEYALSHKEEWPRVIGARVLRTWGLFQPGVWFGLGSAEIRSIEFAKRTMWTGWLLIAVAPFGSRLVARQSFARIWLLLAPIATVTLTTAIAYGNTRFRAAAEPSLILLAAVAGTALWHFIRRVSAER